MAPILVSADAHCLEPEDLWRTRLAREEWRGKAPGVQRLPGGMKKMTSASEASYDYRDYTIPGHLDADDRWHECDAGDEYELVPYDQDVRARLRDLDRDGVWAETTHPNAASYVFSDPDPAFALACARVYNDYVAERLASERIYPCAMIPVGDIEGAIAEVERAASLGLRGMELPMTAPAPYFLRRYDRLWAAIRDKGYPVNLHIGTGRVGDAAIVAVAMMHGGGIAGSIAAAHINAERSQSIGASDDDEWNRAVDATKSTTAAVGLFLSAAPTLIDLVAGGVCARFPELHFIAVETGAGWLAGLMQGLDAAWRAGIGTHRDRGDSGTIQIKREWRYPLRPSEYIRRQVHVTFMEDHAALQNRFITGIEPLLWGNDYPHHEGSWPMSRDACRVMSKEAGLTDAEQRAIFGGTVAALYGIPLPPEA
jgi:predicted TIM-barrel fold metal-dependent hydrolase